MKTFSNLPPVVFFFSENYATIFQKRGTNKTALISLLWRDIYPLIFSKIFQEIPMRSRVQNEANWNI